MPSGIDAALNAFKISDAPVPFKVNTNGFEPQKKQKPTVTEATIDPAEAGIEKCKSIVKEQEFKIRKLKEKMEALPPTKKNKPDIAKLKDEIEVLQADGNYRAALGYVRKLEEDERVKRREAKDKEDEDALAKGIKGKKSAEEPAKKAAPAKKAETTPEATVFECDTEVVAVVRSAIEGSEEAQNKLREGPGFIKYSSVVRAEVPTMTFTGAQEIPSKLKKAGTRDGALKTIRALLWNPSAVLPALPAVLMLLEEAKLKTEPSGTATNLCNELAKAGPAGKAMPQLVLPILLAHMGSAASGKWKVKVGVMGMLQDVIQRMREPSCCPKQFGLMMPKIMTAVRDAVGDARKEVKREAETLLRHIGQELTGTPEIRTMADDIISSILDSANMDKAGATLQQLANTTFMNTVDSCSFGLLFPIVSRAMREQAHESKMKGVQLVGASVDLISDPELLQPYVTELIPLLKECLMHPTDGIQHEAAKAVGSLAAGLPALNQEEIWPYLLEKLQSAEVNEDVAEVERRGAAMGMAQVLLSRKDLLPHTLYHSVLPGISTGSSKEKKAGRLALIQALVRRGPQAFLPHLPRSLQVVLDALMEDSEVITKQAVAAIRTLIDEYGGTYPHLLLPRMQESLFFEPEEAQTLAMQLFYSLCEKIAEAMKYSQDFLTVDALPLQQRHLLVSSIFIAARDPNVDVRRLGSLLWKERIQSGPKAKAEIMPVLQQILKCLKTSGKPSKKRAAEACLKELMGAGDLTQEAFEAEEPLSFLGPSADAEAAPLEVEEPPAPQPPRSTLLQHRVQEKIGTATLPAPMKDYIEAVLISCVMETRGREAAEAAMEAELLPLVDKNAKSAHGSALSAFGLKPMLDSVFDGIADVIEDCTFDADDSDSLIRVDNLRMMYGGGHLLLKDTRLEMKRGRRYGVVGRNGAGKTTLMSTIASGGISQIPSHIKTLHVRPEVLVEASDMTAVQFCKRESERKSEEISEESFQKALQEVGFPSDMQAKSVNELSGGWRMKLLLASAMMHECDILLLDEPTNHLDTESVKWLSEYLRSLTKTSLMVISHDPNFLNAVCTDIIQYSLQRTLEYCVGNFDDFRKARRISSDEEAEALLLGRDTFDKETASKEVAEEDAQATSSSSTAVTAGLLDKTSKISFPIPGTLKGHSSAKPVMELKNVWFAYNEQDGPMVLQDVSCKVSLSSRIGIVGANGAGKSTLLNLLCGELYPTPSPEGKPQGELFQHRNLRLAYISQHHMFHLSEFMNSSPYVYIQKRYKNGWDEALQKRLIEPPNEEEARQRKELATKYGKYGNEVQDILSRQMRGKELFYEVQWKNLDDPKSNTFEPLEKLKKMGVASLAKAYDERYAAQSAGTDQRALSEREIVKHFEQFGLDEDMVMHREIGGFSAGQKSKLTLGAAFWTKPHIVALDEPTNYIDMETLDALTKALARFKGGVIVISHASDFVDAVCTETWLVDGASIASRTKKGEKDKK